MREALKRLKQEAEVYRQALAHPRTPRLARFLLGFTLLYALSPIDLIPDFIPVLGHLDDALILPLTAWFALRLIPKEVLEECRKEVYA